MNSDNFKQNLINAVLGKLGSNTKYSPEIEQYLATLPQEQRQGVANGLNFGNKDILANQQRLGINIPQGEEQIALARQGQFNLPTEGAVRQGGLINGYNQGYNLNYDNPTDQISTRIGQALGTIKRGADSPLGRAVIAYGASRMMGDANPLKQAATAYGTRENANTANQLYRAQLNKMGIDTSKIGGEINADIYKNMIAGYNAGTKTITLQELANLGDERAINAIKNGANPFTTINNSIGRDMLNNVSGLNDARIENYNARTNNINQLTPLQVAKMKNDIQLAKEKMNLAWTKYKNGTGTLKDAQNAEKLYQARLKSLEMYGELTDEQKAQIGLPSVLKQNGTPAPQVQPKQNANGSLDF